MARFKPVSQLLPGNSESKRKAGPPTAVLWCGEGFKLEKSSPSEKKRLVALLE